MRLQSSFSTQIASFVLAAALIGGIARAQSTNQEQQIVIPQGESTIVLEPYAPNVIRVTLSLDKAEAMAAPGYGIEAKPMPAGWTYQEGESARTYRSSRIVVTLLGEGSSGKGAADAAPKSEPTNVQKTQASIARFFNGSAPWADIRFTTPDGKLLLEMNGWQMSVPNYKDGNASIVYDKRPQDKDFYQEIGRAHV